MEPGGAGVRRGHEGGASVMELVGLEEKEERDSLSLCMRNGHVRMQGEGSYRQAYEESSDQKPNQRHLGLGLPSILHWEKIHFCCLSHPV